MIVGVHFVHPNLRAADWMIMITPFSKKTKSAIYFVASFAALVVSVLLINWLENAGIYHFSEVSKKIIGLTLFVLLMITGSGAHDEWVKTRKQWKKWNRPAQPKDKIE